MKTGYSPIVGRAAGLLLCVTATVQAQFKYEIHEGTVTITRYTGPGGDVVIPDSIDGKPVTTLGYEAFRDRGSLTSMRISPWEPVRVFRAASRSLVHPSTRQQTVAFADHS